MNVEVMKMPREEARAKLKEYRTGLHKRVDAEWSRAATAYEAAAEGKALIILSAAIANAPRDAEGRPRLAIARADQKQVVYRRDSWRHPGESFEIYNAHPLLRDGVISTPACPAMPATGTGYALIPMVPPSVRKRMDLKPRYILWEVDAWSDTWLGAVPDRDPYLLEKVADDLFAVVGEWELTDIERAVMRDRARG